MADFALKDLAAIIAERANAPVDASYTAKLLQRGPSYAARKFGEEAVETIVAAVEGDAVALASEAADTLYHLLVVLQARGVPLSAVMAELEKRTGQSGLAEKASRTAG